jgi:hypothetical protein
MLNMFEIDISVQTPHESFSMFPHHKLLACHLSGSVKVQPPVA